MHKEKEAQLLYYILYLPKVTYKVKSEPGLESSCRVCSLSYYAVLPLSANTRLVSQKDTGETKTEWCFSTQRKKNDEYSNTEKKLRQETISVHWMAIDIILLSSSALYFSKVTCHYLTHCFLVYLLIICSTFIKI